MSTAAGPPELRNEARLATLLEKVGAPRHAAVNASSNQPHPRRRRSVEIDLPFASSGMEGFFGTQVDHERWYAALVSSDLGVWDWHLVDNYCYMSDQYIHMLGFEVEEWGETVLEWSDRLHPDDVDSTTAAMRAHIEGRVDFYVADFRLMTKSGTYKWIQTRGRAVQWDEEGHPTRLIGTHTDIDQRKHAEEQLRQQAMLVEKAHDAIFVVDLDHKITTWNGSAEVLFGYPIAEAQGRDITEVLGTDREVIERGLEQTRRTGEWSGELNLTQVGRDQVVGDCRLTLVRDAGGEPSAILAITTDITQRKDLERQFFRTQRMESIGTLAGGIAHDLNNVLAPILLYGDMLAQEHANDAETLDQLAGIQTSAQRASDLVSQLLNFARGAQGNRLALRLDQLVLETAKIARETFGPHITIDTQISDGLSLVEGDPTQLHQVLVNLCVNARDAMPESGTLTITACDKVVEGNHPAREPGAQRGRFCLIEVRDTGVGISASALPQIFDPFFTQKPTGTGIGLSSAQSIVTSHGGFIHVLSKPGQGSTFQVFIPAHGKSGAEVIDASDAAELRGAGEVVLVVDDEEIVRQVLARMLTECGYSVLLAADGAEALRLFTEGRAAVQAVLTDLMMPVMEGTELIRELRKLDPEIHIVATSGVNSPDSKQAAISAGAAAFIPKPYTTKDLLRTLTPAGLGY